MLSGCGNVQAANYVHVTCTQRVTEQQTCLIIGCLHLRSSPNKNYVHEEQHEADTNYLLV